MRHVPFRRYDSYETPECHKRTHVRSEQRERPTFGFQKRQTSEQLRSQGHIHDTPPSYEYGQHAMNFFFTSMALS